MHNKRYVGILIAQTVKNQLLSTLRSIYADMNMRINMVMLLRHTGVHNSNAVRAALAKARMFSVAYLSELLRWVTVAVFFDVRLLAASRFAGIAIGVFHCNS